MQVAAACHGAAAPTPPAHRWLRRHVSVVVKLVQSRHRDGSVLTVHPRLKAHADALACGQVRGCRRRCQRTDIALRGVSFRSNLGSERMGRRPAARCLTPGVAEESAVRRRGEDAHEESFFHSLKAERIRGQHFVTHPSPAHRTRVRDTLIRYRTPYSRLDGPACLRAWPSVFQSLLATVGRDTTGPRFMMAAQRPH